MSILVNNSIVGAGLNQTSVPVQPGQPVSGPQPNAADQEAAAQTARAAASAAQLEEQLQEALQKTGIRAEIENKANGMMVVRYVDQQTQHVEFQIPTETVLSLVASLNESARSGEPVAPGALIDEQA